MDTAALIYWIESNPRYSATLRPLIEAIDAGEKEGVASFIGLVEVLVKPLQEGRRDLAERYRRVLVGQATFRLVAVDRAVAEQAARIRAHYGFKIPDAIQLATAVVSRADAVLTNDTRLRRFADVPIVVLDDHVFVS
jgi:predicted nucleic acid-binding protein